MMRVIIAMLLVSIFILPALSFDSFAANSGDSQAPPFSVSSESLSGSKSIKQPNGIVERTVHIFYKEGFGHKASHGGGAGGTTEKCYAFLGNGVKWKTTESYIVDSTNSAGLSDDFVRSKMTQSLETWDSQVSFDIFGAEGLGVVDGIDTQSTDGKNEVMFGSIEEPGAIAVTVTWAIFIGPPSQRQIVEWDMIFDDSDFAWGDGLPTAMDFQNIATHEIGHAGGMGHPSDSCTEETMYRFASEGEIKKRDLNSGDITGIKALYK